MLHGFYRLRALALAALATLMFSAPVAAHSFNVSFLVPMGSSTDVLSGAILASDERDSHAGQDSDGHLGGLDVFFDIVSWNYLAGDINRIVMESAPDIIVFLGTPMDDRVVPARFANVGPWIVTLRDVSAKAERDFLGAGDASFAARFRARYGVEPSENARLAYVAARLIDIAVRAQGGAEDKDSLARAVRGY